MTNTPKTTSKIAPGLILLAVSCVTMGYGLCSLVNALDASIAPLGIGIVGAVLSTSMILRIEAKLKTSDKN